ncbi:uncharacterized protein LOC122657005 isoform X2 [Telopea speciosissima]|uniref:uncharacterized protein LOC122657005 isoform X2 n=1 Tax=Telopea speciosissima TaxID=54955 RepID=UPI001CC64652|nr:uncharacterized protein LOC122657005 isoform X2 [Telopea speciosissima]
MATKKISEIRVEDHFQTRKSPSRRGFSGGLNSKIFSSSRISHEEAKDMRRVKRVRFTDPDTVYQHNCKPDASSIASKGTQTQKFDDPKTLEYAFYKRLREGTELSNHLHNQDGQLKKVEASNCSRAVDHLAKYRCEEVRPLLAVRVTPTELRSSLCLGEALKNQVTISSKHLEPHNSHEEVFSKKRRKLCQWVAKASSLDVDEISSKGYDVVSVLLQRLVPQCNASERRMPPSSRYEVLSTRSQLIASSDSDMHFEELRWTPTPSMHFTEPTFGKPLDDDTSECRSNKSGVVTSSQWDTLNSKTLSTRNSDKFDSQWDVLDSDSLSTRNADIVDLQYRNVQPYRASDENATVLHTKMKPCWFTDMDRDSLKRNGSLPQDQVPLPSKLEYSSKNSFSSLWDSPNQSFGPSNNLSFPVLDEFHKKNDFALGIDHITQFLDRNDGDLCNSVVKASPIRTIVLRDDHEQSPSKYDAIGLDSLPFPAIHRSASMTSLLDFWSERYHYQTIGRSFEENDYSVAVKHHLPLTFSCYQSYLPQGCRLLGNYRGNDVFNYLHTPRSFTNQVFSEKLCSNVGTLVLPSGLDSDFRWKNLLMNDSLGEYRSSICPNYKFNAKQTQDVSFPLLTEEQSKWSMDDSSENEMQSQQTEEIFMINHP